MLKMMRRINTHVATAPKQKLVIVSFIVHFVCVCEYAGITYNDYVV